MPEVAGQLNMYLNYYENEMTISQLLLFNVQVWMHKPQKMILVGYQIIFLLQNILPALINIITTLDFIVWALVVSLVDIIVIQNLKKLIKTCRIDI
jgi:hypothetical protein